MTTKWRYGLLWLVLFALQLAAAGPSDIVMGRWVLDLNQSTYSPGPAPISQVLVYERFRDGFRRTGDTVNADGSTTHQVTVGKFDGKDYKVEGAPTNDTAAFRLTADGSEEVVNKTDGKVMNTNKVTFSRDGKTMTQTQTFPAQWDPKLGIHVT